MSFSSIEKAREHNYREVEDIYLSLDYPEHELSCYVNNELWNELPVRRSNMSFFARQEIDFDVSFVRPMAADQLETIFRTYYGANGEGLHLETYSAERKKTGSQDDDIAETYGLYLACHIQKIHPNVVFEEGEKWQRPLVERSSWFRSHMTFDGYESFSEFSIHPPVLWGLHAHFALSNENSPASDEDLSSCKPHMSCIISTGGVFDERPLRSELLAITKLMMGRMRLFAWNRAHKYFPVFCYALNGPYVRATHAYFDGQYLQLRQSEAVEIMPEDGSLDSVKMVFRWIMGEPTLDTRWHGTVEDSNGPSVNHLPRGPGDSTIMA